MKTNVKYHLLIMLMVAVTSVLLFLNSCNGKEDPEDPETCAEFFCENGGTAIEEDGVCRCDCPEGFSGESCQIQIANCSGTECPEGQTPNPAEDCLCE